MFDDEENYSEEYNEIPEEYLQEMEEIAIKKNLITFIEGCYEAYDLLLTKGKNALETGTEESIASAINRMTALFLRKEEYERCSFLKNFVEENMPNRKVEPDKEVLKELQNLEKYGLY
jgi:ferritin